MVVTSAEVIMQMAEGKVKPREAYAQELIRAYGDVELLSVLPLGLK